MDVRESKVVEETGLLQEELTKRAQEALRRSVDETARGHRLLLALSQAAQAVQRTRTPDEVYRAIGEEVAALGYQAVVATLTDDRAHVAVSYLTFEPALLRAAEKLAGISIQDHRFAVVPGSIQEQVIDEGQTIFFEQVVEPMAQGLPRLARPLVGQVATILGLEQAIYAPLRVGAETHGLLIVTGVGLSEADVPAVTALANQALIAIENAGLFEEVERTRDYLQNLIESSPDAIVTTDRHGRINLFSKGAESIFGYKASEVIAQPASNYFRDSMEVMRIMRRLLREGRLRNYEMEVIDKNGRVIPTVLSASLLRDEEGAITGTLGIIKDITDRKRLEEELRRYADNLEEMVEERTEALISLNEQLEKANRLKSEFVSAVSHELRAPLFAIVGMSEMLLDRGVKDRGWAMEYLQMINEQGNRLARLIDDLLDLSRIESGKQVYHWESVHIGEVIKESIQFLKAQAEEKGIAISHRIEKDLPPVEADRDKMRQVLINLISNSLSYSDEGAKVKVFARQLTVRRGPKRGEKVVGVSVTDSGWGIPPEDLPHIFEKFYRGQEHQRRTRGSGLGLALVKEIVAAHGGTVEVKSKVGKGSKFTVKLPLS